MQCQVVYSCRCIEASEAFQTTRAHSCVDSFSPCNMLMAVLLPFLCYLNTAAAGKLLVIPMDGSHWLSMKEVLAELSSRGHEIVVVAPDSSILIDSSGNYTMKTYPVPYKQEEMEELMHTIGTTTFSELPLLTRLLDTWEHFRKTSAMFQAALLWNACAS